MSNLSQDPFEEPKKEPEAPHEPIEEKEEPKSASSKLYGGLTQNPKLAYVHSYFRSNTQDAIAYILMIIGIIWFFFIPFYGSILIGLIAGFYFSSEIIKFIKQFNLNVEKEGVAKIAILLATLLMIFIVVPGIFFGAAIMVGIKMLIQQENKS